MPKNNINLLIRSQKQAKYKNQLNLIVPIISGVSLLVFFIFFFIIYFYLNSNITRYNNLINESVSLEKKILSKQSLYAIYERSSDSLNTLNTILSSNKNFYPLISQINGFSKDGISVTTARTDGTGNVNLSISADSASDLDIFIESISQEYVNTKLYSKVKAEGITRNKDGKYSLTLSFSANKDLYK